MHVDQQFYELSPVEQALLIREANIPDDRPQGESLTTIERYDWIKSNRKLITPLLFRHIDLRDQDVAKLVAERTVLVQRKLECWPVAVSEW